MCIRDSATTHLPFKMGYDLAGWECQTEVKGRRYNQSFAHLVCSALYRVHCRHNILHADGKADRRLLYYGNKLVCYRRKNVLDGLRQDNKTHGFPGRQAQRAGRLRLASVNRLDAGADDYLVKPFSFQELEARIKALLRRSKEVPVQQLVCGDLILDCTLRRARRGNMDIDLTVKEYRLLEYFLLHQRAVLSRLTLLRDVWDKNFDTNTNVVDVYVNYLRAKIDKGFEDKLIHTVVGVGYMMTD